MLTLKGKPEFATAKEWRDWERTAKAEQPVAYWLHEVFLDGIRMFWKYRILGPINSLRYAIRHRFFDRYNIIHTGLKAEYWDCDTRMLHGMFNMLVDFVEVEKAWMHVVFTDGNREKYGYPWWSLGWTRFKGYRCSEAGLDHLRWEMTLDDPSLPIEERSDSQARQAREIMELYNWWKHVRPTRVDPMDASGWSEHCDRRRASKSADRSNDEDDAWSLLDDEDETDAEREHSLSIIHKTHDIEKSYDDEDEAMLIRLVKIRKGLWT